MPHRYSFISYTTREDEIKDIKPFIDKYLIRVKERLPFFYDGVHIPPREYSDSELNGILHSAICSCDFTTAFISPSYFNSSWCLFEWTTSLNEGKCPILPIIWKRTHYPIKQVSIRIYEEIENRAFETAMNKAVQGTLDFIERCFGKFSMVEN